MEAPHIRGSASFDVWVKLIKVNGDEACASRRARGPQNIIAEKSLRTFCEWAVGLLNCNKGCVPGPHFIRESRGVFSWTFPLCRLMAECFVPVMCCAWSTHGPQFNTNTSECTNLWEICSTRAEVTWILLLKKRKTIFTHIKDTVTNEQKEMSWYYHKVEKEGIPDSADFKN